MIERVEIHRGAYYDSLSLMVLSRDAAAVDGVVDAAALAGTPLNLELLGRQGFRLPPDQPTSSDIVVAIRARDETAFDAADQLIRRWLTGRREEPLAAAQHVATARNVRALTRRNPEVNLLMVSVPGRYAAYEVAAGLEASAHVFCFSSGMEISQERTLKALALEKGLLLMGPDCGTAILDGIGIGFANAVRAGPVGLVGASGTGMQEVSCLLDSVGIGISQAIGVGGRDLNTDVGGLMTHRAMDLLIEDPETGSIVVLSKPPDLTVADALVAHAAESPKPVVLGFLGDGSARHGEGSEKVQIVHSLEEAAARAAALHDVTLPAHQLTPPKATPGFVRGLFCGGSLCYEAMGILTAALGPVWSNTPLRPEWELPAIGNAIEHTLLDFGDEVLTDGRLHPMIDPSLRNERALREALDLSVGVLLLDVVLGYGAHEDPARELAPIIQEALRNRGGLLTVVVAVCGTEADPQDLEHQCRLLESAGAFVTRRSADAARFAVAASGAAMRPAAGADPEAIA